MKKYISVFRIRYIAALQYRTAAAAGMLTQFAWALMEILAFAAFYRSSPSAFPMTLSQTVAYIWLEEAFLTLFTLVSLESEFSSAIETGAVAYELVRPIDLYNRWFSQNAANRLARATLRCAPILLVAFVFPAPYRLMLPPDAVQAVLFALSLVLALGVAVAFSMLMHITVFYTISARGTKLVLGLLADFFAGAVIPLPFFPEPLRTAVSWLPFAAMQNMPLRIYCGHITGAQAALGIALQVFWTAALLLLGKLFMRRALKKVVIQGG